ncbi:hypothetical protein SAMN04487981_102755 [Streptomyces sp. cf386]|nr:hypothetical protein SAMN04487981_102755 [Streptomyces sp. cf386]
MPLPRIRLQQLQHHGVIRVPIPRKRPPHDPRQMQIPHGHRIRRPMTALHNLRRRPRPNPRQDLQPPLRLRRRHPHGLLQPRSNPYGPQNRGRPLVVDPGPMPLPGRNRPPGPRIRHHTHLPGHGPRRRLPELPNQQPPRPVRLIGRDLLLQNRRNQRLHHQPGPRQPQPRPSMPSNRHHPMPRHEGGRIIGGPEQLRQLLQQPLGPRPPRFPPHLGTPHADPQRPGPDRRTTGPPHGPVRHRPKRRIPRPTPQRPQHQPEIERPVGHHRPHLPRRDSLPRHTRRRRHSDMPTAHSRTCGPRSKTSCHEESRDATRWRQELRLDRDESYEPRRSHGARWAYRAPAFPNRRPPPRPRPTQRSVTAPR